MIGTGTTYYIGNYYEVYVNGATTFNKYYYFGSQRVAAKIAGTLFYFQGDHLGSSSIVMTQAGTSFYTRQTYFPYGAQRTTEGSALPTDYTFTGQKSDDSTGLMFYGARYYDVTLGRFTQPDTIVPSPLNPQSLNRFAYTLNNPVRYIDPSGHMEQDPGAGGGSNGEPNDPIEQEVVVPGDEPGGVYILPVDTGDNQEPDTEKKLVIKADPDDPLNQARAKYLDGAATVFDIYGLVLSGIGVAVEAGGCIAGSAVPGAGTLAGCGLGIALYQFANLGENLAGVASFAATVGSDYYSGQNYIDFENQEVSVGMESVASGVFMGVGALSPEATIDTVINGVAVMFDVARLSGTFPDLGPIKVHW